LIKRIRTRPSRSKEEFSFDPSTNMSISYEEALETLQSMFGDAWSRENLDTVLRHQQGHMENTVDVILRHGDKDPQVLIDQLAAGIDPEESVRSMDEALARQLSQGSGASIAAASARPKGNGTPTTLPDDFLRIPGGFTPQSVVDDEMLARMLQDELFSQELARNPQFAHLARGRPGGGGGGAAAATGTARRTFTARGGPSGAPSSPGGPNLLDKISELGDNARRKLQIMAAQFNASRANNQGGGGGDGGGTAAGHPSGSAAAGGASSAAERRGLLDDVDDLELAARKDL
jgi:hypothetical protein